MTADTWMGEIFITAARAVMMDTHDIRRRWQHVLMLLLIRTETCSVVWKVRRTRQDT